uniref:Titin n=1 Tax=Dicentrarchus labrax TaxID=13489 RepID=A0A8C4IEU0_DICLA
MIQDVKGLGEGFVSIPSVEHVSAEAEFPSEELTSIPEPSLDSGVFLSMPESQVDLTEVAEEMVGEVVELHTQIKGEDERIDVAIKPEPKPLIVKPKVDSRRDGDSISLTIHNVTKADQGEYICEAVNYVGEARSVALVVVVSQEVRFMPAPPTVTHQHVMEFDVEEDDSSRSPSPQEILLEVELDENEVKEFEKQVKIITIPEYTADNKSMIISLDVLPSIYEEGAVDFVTQEHDDLKIAFEVTEMPPRFINPICDMETPEGTTVMFECSLMGIPSPIVSWFKGDKKIPHNNKKYLHSSDGDNHFLKICKVTSQDSGVYTCRAINVVGETLCRASLVVLNAKAFSGKTRGRECSEGGEVSFNYKASGDPIPDVKWFKGAFQIQPSRNCIIIANPDGSGFINIKSIKQEDSGLYTCKASNQFGEATCSAELVVFRESASVSPAVNDPLRLECQVDEDTGVSVTWTRDGKKVHQSMDCKLSFEDKVAVVEIPKSKQKDSGKYVCTATNEAGSSSFALNVTVLDVPAAPIGPANILEVTPDSMMIEWRPPKDDGGSPVTNYIVEKRESKKETWGGVSSGSLATQLNITRLQKGVEYVVRIRAANKMGIGAPLESKPTVAEHSFMPPSQPGKPQTSDIAEDAVTVGWTMPLSDGGSQISGYIVERRHKGGKWIRVNKTPCKDLRYRVLGLFEGNEYEFRVFAENIAGYSGPSPISDPCKPCRPITIPGPPVNPKVKDYSKTTADLVWTKPNKDGGSPILGYNVEMKKADIEEWKKVNLDDFIKQCAYRVKGLEEGVTYRFRVYATNIIGDGEVREIPESITAQDILIPPEIEMDATCRERVTVRVGHNINIIGYIKARPDPEVLWSKEETVLENSKRVTIIQNFPVVHLKIKEATRADHGKYILKASNEGGEASCTITVNVLDRPSHCQNLHVTYATKDSCMINWEAPKDNGGSEITNYIVECREPSISMWSMISSSCTNRKIKAKLMEGHEYLFRVCAENKMGPGPSVETKVPLLAIDCIEKPGEPENFRATDIGKNHVYLRWRKPDYDGGSPNISYNLECKAKDAEEWEKLNTATLTDTFFLADKCTENQTYTFR